jgi:hypothetical protein
MSDLIDYIRIQWDDIHHSRNQEWKYFTIISGSIATAVGVALWKTDVNVAIRITFLIFSLILCSMGGYITYAHWLIFYGKKLIICNFERKLGIHVVPQRAPLSVQGMIFLFHFWFAAILVGVILWLSIEILWVAISSAAIVLIGGFAITFILSKKLRSRFEQFPANNTIYPLFAEQDDLESCLESLKNRPLKLIAGGLYNDEVVWEKLKWDFQVNETRDIVNKKLLLNTKDNFQISVANQHSKQDFHLHEQLYEIYISVSKICCEYFVDGHEDHPVSISHGILIIPPGVTHKVKLSGTTYVFQCSISNCTVGGDRLIYNENVANN